MEGPYFSKLAIYYFWLLWVFVAVTVFLWFWKAGTTLYLWWRLLIAVASLVVELRL